MRLALNQQPAARLQHGAAAHNIARVSPYRLRTPIPAATVMMEKSLKRQLGFLLHLPLWT
jgi:hypothetical protein